MWSNMVSMGVVCFNEMRFKLLSLWVLLFVCKTLEALHHL